ncbi:MAG: hypothetical protein AABX52_03310 [Nanoarchaeota archaeon]
MATQKHYSLFEAVKDKLSKSEQKHIPRSYDTLGNLIIIEIPKEIEKKEKIIGQTILNLNPHILTVCKKVGTRLGIYRKQKLKIIAGKKSKEAHYIENGVHIVLHAEKVYFSPRLSSDRLRIAKLVQPNERVLVMFSGCGPYPLVISRNQPNVKIVGVESNPIAHTYAEENKRINKFKQITNYLGDVRNVVPKLGLFNRVIMALPKSAMDFLEIAIPALAPKGYLHIYSFAHEDYFLHEAERIKNICSKLGKPCILIRVVKCGAYKPHVYRICIELHALK